jgi:flagellar biosynthetic protein FliQ
MSSDAAIEIVRQAIVLALTVSAPLLLVSLAVGVLVSLIQAITQIQEQTLTFIPKILAVGVVFLLMLPWILNRLISYLVGSITSLGSFVSR